MHNIKVFIDSLITNNNNNTTIETRIVNNYETHDKYINWFNAVWFSSLVQQNLRSTCEFWKYVYKKI